MSQLIVKELGRSGFKEFGAGFGVVALFGLSLNAGITDADRAASKYYQDFKAPKKAHH